MSRRWFWILFSTIVLLAGVTRLWQLGQVPVSVYWDEAAMLVDIKSVLATGRDMHTRSWYQLIYPSYGDYKLPAYIWSATAASKLVGFGEFGLRLPSAIAGVLSVVLVGALVRVLLQIGTRTKYSHQFLDQTQLLTMLVLAVTPWSIIFSRTGFEGHLGQMLLSASLLSTAWAWKKKALPFFLLAGALGALATYSYFSVRFVWVAVYLGLLIVAVMQTSSFREHQWKKLSKVLLGPVLGVVLFGLLIIPLLRSPLAKDADKFRLGTDSVLNTHEYAIQSNVYRELAGNAFIDRIIYNRFILLFQELAKNYSDHLTGSFLFLSGDPNLRHGTTQQGLFLLIFAPALVIGLGVLLKRHFTVGLFLVGWWMTALLPASVPENTPHALRSLNALAPLSMMIGFGVSWWWSACQKMKFGKALQWLTLGVIFVSFVQFLCFYFRVYPKLSASEWQSGYKPLAQQITTLTQQGKTVIIQPFDDRFYLWLMAYGPYTPQEFQKWPTENYKFQTDKVNKSFAGIDFQGYGDDDLKKRMQERSSFILVGELDSISERCNASVEYKCSLQTVNDEAGSPRFALATFTP